MADESMQVPAEEKDLLEPDTEIPVRIDSLEADGVRPSVGDNVTIKIDGTVKSIQDDCVYVTPDQVNGDDLAERRHAVAERHGCDIGGDLCAQHDRYSLAPRSRESLEEETNCMQSPMTASSSAQWKR